jgi:hypothetical protein
VKSLEDSFWARPIVKKGKTPVLDGDEVRTLLDSVDVSTLVGLRDRALELGGLRHFRL